MTTLEIKAYGLLCSGAVFTLVCFFMGCAS